MQKSALRQARRSEAKEGRRSASAAPPYIHLVPLFLLLLLSLAGLHVNQVIVKPLLATLASSRPSVHSPSTPSSQTDSFHFYAFTPEVQRWGSQIELWASQSELPVELIATVVQIESCGDPLARSGAGALGLFQVMPFHFEKDQDPLLVEVNAGAGLAYLADAYRLAEGDLARSLAGYNGGHSVINRPASDWPAETQRYVNWGAGILQDIRQSNLPSPTLEAWLAAGGRHLCQQASLRPLASR